MGLFNMTLNSDAKKTVTEFLQDVTKDLLKKMLNMLQNLHLPK
jgi:hypothetical protein